MDNKGSHIFCNYQKDKKQCIWFINYYCWREKYISAQNFVNFASFYQFYPIYYNRTIVKLTPLETCFKVYKISEIQELPGTSPPGSQSALRLRPGPTGSLRAALTPPVSKSVAPPNFKSWIRPLIKLEMWHHQKPRDLRLQYGTNNRNRGERRSSYDNCKKKKKKINLYNVLGENRIQKIIKSYTCMACSNFHPNDFTNYDGTCQWVWQVPCFDERNDILQK
jgi:hypothetical protein